jgi:hypothetical protein
MPFVFYGAFFLVSFERRKKLGKKIGSDRRNCFGKTMHIYTEIHEIYMLGNREWKIVQEEEET